MTQHEQLRNDLAAVLALAGRATDSPLQFEKLQEGDSLLTFGNTGVIAGDFSYSLWCAIKKDDAIALSAMWNLIRTHGDRLTALLNADAAVALMRGQSWQPIETIPDTGSPEFPFGVLVADGKRCVFTAHCSRNSGSDFYIYSGPFHITGATHWQPLPIPPKDSADEQ